MTSQDDDSTKSPKADLIPQKVVNLPSRGVPPPPSDSDGSLDDDTHRARRRDGVSRLLFGIFGTLIYVTLMLALFTSSSPSLRIYRSKVGEQLPISLPDGTVALLNTQSTLRLWRAGAEWHTDLLEGEAFFDRASATKKYSPVTVGDIEMSAAQGKFIGRILEDGASQLTVAAGSAVISAFNMHQMVLYTNQRAVFRYSSHPAMYIESFSDVDIQRQLSWRYGALQFSHADISTAVSEFNRYNKLQIELSGGFENVKIDGMFIATDPIGFVRTALRLDRNILLKTDDSNPDHTVLRLIHLPAHRNPSRQNQMQHQRSSEEAV